MPIAPNGSWVNYTFSNCQLKLINGNITLQNVSFSQLNGSGLLCSISVNFPWFWVALLIVMYIVFFFMFSYMRSIRLFLVSSSLEFIFASILDSYGFIGPGTWFMTFGILVVSMVVTYMASRG